MKKISFLLALASLACCQREVGAQLPKEAARTTPLPPGFVRERKMGLNWSVRPDGQIEITSIRKGFGAEKAGVQSGDILVAVDGCAIKKRADVLDVLAKKTIGDPVPMTVLRNGAQMTLNVELAFFDVEEPLFAIKRILYEDKKVSLVVMGGVVVNTKLSNTVALEQWAKGIKSSLISKWENRFLKYFGASESRKEFSIVDRQAVEHVLKELNFGQSGVVTEECRAKLGRTLGATHMLMLDFERLGDSDTEHERLIEIETGKVLVSSTQHPPTPEEIKKKARLKSLAAQFDESFGRKDYAAAVNATNEAIALDPGNPCLFNNRGVAKGRLGDLAGAVADYQKALQLKPDYSLARDNLNKLRQNMSRRR